MVLDLTTLTLSLSDLADFIQKEQILVESDLAFAGQAALSALDHVCNIGEALLTAREQVEPGDWQTWVTENTTLSRTQCQKYQRAALYRGTLETWAAEGGSGSLNAAMRVLQGLPTLTSPARAAPTHIDKELRAEANRLLADGLTYGEIGRLLGRTGQSIREWVDRDYRRQRKQAKTAAISRKNAAERALAAQERAQAVKKAGGAAADAYALIRRFQIEIGHALEAARTDEERAALRQASSHAYKAEDAIHVALTEARLVA